jgi:flagellin-specific chaperone FliS
MKPYHKIYRILFPKNQRALSIFRYSLFGKITPLILFVIFLSVASISLQSAHAQEPIDAARRELQILDQLLAMAREVIAAYPSEEARNLLMKAEMLRKEAENKIGPGRPDRPDVGAALALIKQATALAKQAMAVALRNPLQRLISTVELLINRADQIVAGSGNREAERLLRDAKKFMAEGESAMRGESPYKAALLYERARISAEQALKLVEGRRPVTDMSLDQVRDRERIRFDNLSDRAREAVEGQENPAAMRVLRQAFKQRDAAEEAFRRGDITTAQQLYNGAIRLLLRGIDLALNEQRGQGNVRQQAALLEDLIQAAERDLEASADTRAAMLLERARVLVREAQAAIERNQAQEARWRLELARNFIERAIRRAGPGAVSPLSFEQRCEEALQELTQDLGEVSSKAREANNVVATSLVEMAASAHKAADAACRQGQAAEAGGRNFAIALQLIRTAHLFLLRAETLLRESPQTALPTRDAVAQRLTQVDAALGEMRQESASGGELSQTLLQQATQLRERARVALERGQLNVASETIAVAFDLIRESVKLSAPNQNQPR